MPTYCDADGCESEATEVVPVSIDEHTVQHRRYCYPCSEAYHTGAQHGRFRAVRQLEAYAESLKEQGLTAEAGVIFAATSRLNTATDPGEDGVETPPLDRPGDR